MDHDYQQLSAAQPQQRRRPRPAEQIQGLDVVFYKDMGSAVAVMNVASLGLPDWILPLESAAEAERVRAILDEHIGVVRSIQSPKGDERAEEYALLDRYRAFFAGRDIERFLDFAAFFGPYVMHRLDQGAPIARFSVASLKRLFAMTRPTLSAIYDNPGFQRLASAIRSSTVTLNYAKGRGDKVNFTIRYGLLQDIVRRSNSTTAFVKTVTEFVAAYNAESAQRFETSQGTLRRTRISEEDLQQFLSLLDAGYEPALLARLLVAFGSAKVGKEQEDLPVDQEHAEIEA